MSFIIREQTGRIIPTYLYEGDKRDAVQYAVDYVRCGGSPVVIEGEGFYSIVRVKHVENRPAPEYYARVVTVPGVGTFYPDDVVRWDAYLRRLVLLSPMT